MSFAIDNRLAVLNARAKPYAARSVSALREAVHRVLHNNNVFSPVRSDWRAGRKTPGSVLTIELTVQLKSSACNG